MSKRPTLGGQCGLEGIVIKFLLGINQFKDKLTSNSQYPSMGYNCTLSLTTDTLGKLSHNSFQNKHHREQLAQPRRLTLSKALSSVCIAMSNKIAIFHKFIIKTSIYMHYIE